jgi:hypothetical protein
MNDAQIWACIAGLVAVSWHAINAVVRYKAAQLAVRQGVEHAKGQNGRHVKSNVTIR